MHFEYNQNKWGELDLRHLVIDTEYYIVFVDSKLELDWITSKEFDDKGHSDLEKHNNVLNKIALLECKPNDSLPEKITLDFKRLLGEALARSLSSDYETANNLLNNADTYIRERGEELSRQWYLLTAGKTSLAVLIAGLVAWLFRDSIVLIVGKQFFIYGITMVSGALGALLSIIMRMGKENLNCHAGKNLHELESRYRIFAGMLSALLAALAISNGIIFPILSKSSSAGISLVFVGFLGGMSERFAPSILSKLDDKKKNI